MWRPLFGCAFPRSRFVGSARRISTVGPRGVGLRSHEGEEGWHAGQARAVIEQLRSLVARGRGPY